MFKGVRNLEEEGQKCSRESGSFLNDTRTCMKYSCMVLHVHVSWTTMETG